MNFTLTIVDPCAGIMFTMTAILDYTYFIDDFSKIVTYGPWTTSLIACEPITYSITYYDDTPLTAPFSYNSVAHTITTWTDIVALANNYHLKVRG